MTDIHSQNKQLLAPLRAAQQNFDAQTVREQLDALLSADCVVHLFHPLGDLSGPGEFYDQAYAPLLAAIPDLERRDWIVMAGPTEQGGHWVGCGGHYAGTFAAPWLDIPPTGQFVHMRFHEFYRFVDGKVVEIQAIWDVPEVMIQAGAWPMSPSLGRELMVPAPMTQDGFVAGPWDAETSQASCDLVVDMLVHMVRHPSQGGPEVMEMPKFWDPRMSWYGPAAIGTCRGIEGFRNIHQIPFLAAMPDRGQHPDQIEHHFFGDANYVGVTGWPDMMQTVSGDGWLGIAPSDKRITMRSLDFWRVENGKIRENWVTVDILHAYDQLGVDVFRRMRELTRHRR